MIPLTFLLPAALSFSAVHSGTLQIRPEGHNSDSVHVFKIHQIEGLGHGCHNGLRYTQIARQFHSLAHLTLIL
jgi:hypothetical protein